LYKKITDKDVIKSYKIEVHSVKSVSATVGALIISKLARLLEVASNDGNLDRINALHPILIEEITKHKLRLDEIFAQKKDKVEMKHITDLVPYIDTLKYSLEQSDFNTTDLVIEEVNKYSYINEVQELVDKVSSQILNLDADEALITLQKIEVIING